jgi:hypothetical protein
MAEDINRWLLRLYGVPGNHTGIIQGSLTSMVHSAETWLQIYLFSQEFENWISFDTRPSIGAF